MLYRRTLFSIHSVYNSPNFFFQQNKINKTPKENVTTPVAHILENITYLDLVYTHLGF